MMAESKNKATKDTEAFGKAQAKQSEQNEKDADKAADEKKDSPTEAVSGGVLDPNNDAKLGSTKLAETTGTDEDERPAGATADPDSERRAYNAEDVDTQRDLVNERTFTRRGEDGQTYQVATFRTDI